MNINPTTTTSTGIVKPTETKKGGETKKPAIQTSFKGEEPRKTGGGWKAFASFLLPGLGQFCDGRNKEGAMFLGGSIGLSILSGITWKKIVNNIHTASAEVTKRIQKQTSELINASAQDASKVKKSADTLTDFFSKTSKTAGKGKFITAGVLALTSLGWTIASMVDAYKGDRKD